MYAAVHEAFGNEQLSANRDQPWAVPNSLVCLLRTITMFPSGHGNGEDWLSSMSRKCCKDNRMCPGSAVEGRRIQGSYCTLWNGLRNARCLPLFRSATYHNRLWRCVALCWHMDTWVHPPPRFPPWCSLQQLFSPRMFSQRGRLGDSWEIKGTVLYKLIGKQLSAKTVMNI